ILIVAGLVAVQPFFRYVTNYLDQVHKRWVIIAICLLLVILKTAYPNIQVDINTVWLIGIAALLFMLPDLKSLTPYIKRIRIGDTELELKESIENLGKEVERAQDVAAEETETVTTGDVSSEIEKVLEGSSKDPRAALLLLSSKIEEQLRNRLEEADIPTGKSYSITRYVELGVSEGIFPQSFLPAFRDFWSVRNKVAHGAAFDVEDSYILSLISLGTQLLKIASTSKRRPNNGKVTE
ncbi:MAG TPA: hypothetical protein VN843_14305, partial [Anaerolineales bacterium]|nr:hypothetical protein [Anaerolineales bacterium]